ncbi:hypothetical protein [Arenibacter palladensis]|uniref:hypothetical protein n=1 Tax=Arenibacter palladensis TaxID=237373 RepID=UPI0026E22B68|nr:hypothetical protein [Arenibacter palladensis]MDO6602002.1 hypothetical protein [Arenibacter palladensis]
MNRYIKAMEIGLANEQTGITYIALEQQVQEALGKPFNKAARSTFAYWFVENFSYENGKYDLKSFRANWEGYYKYLGGIHEYRNAHTHIESFLIRSYFLDGQAAKQYLDYLELQQSVESSNSARNWAIRSIIVALFAIGISIYSVYNSPQPPYDVKIIEDNPKVKELEENLKQKDKEVDQLREELLKAEMMIRVLEDSENPPTKAKL